MVKIHRYLEINDGYVNDELTDTLEMSPCFHTESNMDPHTLTQNKYNIALCPKEASSLVTHSNIKKAKRVEFTGLFGPEDTAVDGQESNSNFVGGFSGQQ